LLSPLEAMHVLASCFSHKIDMSFRYLIGVVCALALGTSVSVHAQVDAGPPPAEHFFESNAFGGAALSPSGRSLAVRMSKPGHRQFLVVIELDTKRATAVAQYSDFDIGDFQWVNDERLVFNVIDLAEVSGDRGELPGLFGVNRDGSQLIQLASHKLFSPPNVPQPWNTFLFSQRGSQDSDWIYVERPYFDKKRNYDGSELLYLNTRTGAAKRVKPPDLEVSSYLLDAKGQPRLAMRYTEVKNIMYYLDPTTREWREIASYQAYKDTKNEIRPLGFGPDGKLYVIANAGEDLATLRTFDVVSGKLGNEALVATPGYDFAGNLLQNDKLLGVRLMTDARNEIWFDSAMKAVQSAVNKALPGTINLLTVPARPGSPWVLVESYSDRQPSIFTLYDTKTGLLDPIGSAYPNIDTKRMGKQEPIRYKARDGLEIPGLLTLPAGGARNKLPMVVLVHGGPWVRGPSWGWKPETQFLASRGYAVLEVEFRGSTGFGAKHFEAGLKQWGLAMQDDVADGTRWAIAQGIADPRRICIAGSSYGGYAALMGLINDPDLYQCAFEWLGVTDIELMYTGTWSSKPDFSEAYQRYGMPVLIGDLEKDAVQLKATSPIQQAARIRQPLLLAYGSEDRRVPLHHGKQFYEAVKRTNKRVEWVVYDGEGHGWSLAKNRIDFWRRVERFLHKNIGQR
jgi:dipeptidyl aminopeptidase/acylaminoacyl peptidase